MDTRFQILKAQRGWVGNATASLKEIRWACTNMIDPGGRLSGKHGPAIAECIFESCNQATNAVLASRTYMLTLSPAFVVIIVSLAPDATFVQYDSMWWSWIFAATSFGMAGVSKDLPSHHQRALTVCEGRQLCESWKRMSTDSCILPKSHVRNLSPMRGYTTWVEWTSFIVSSLLHITFCVAFLWMLRDSFVIFGSPQQWLSPAISYFTSAVPHLCELLLELWLDRVEVYEPIQPCLVETSDQLSRKRQRGVHNVASESMTDADTKSCVELQYLKSKTGSSLRTLKKVFLLQWTRSRYRILIKPRQNHAMLFIVEALIAVGRLVVFALGSVEFGRINLAPMRVDTMCFVLIVLAACVPRFLWPTLWEKGSCGADLVVRVQLPQEDVETLNGA